MRAIERKNCLESAMIHFNHPSSSSNERESSASSSTEMKTQVSSNHKKRVQDEEKTRSKNRGKKRNGKRTRQQQSRRRTRNRKNKSARINKPAALHQAPNAKKINNETSDALISKESTLNDTLRRPAHEDPEIRNKNSNVNEDIDSPNAIYPRITESPDVPRKKHADNVEHEFSKNLEKELLLSRTERPDSQDESYTTVGSKKNSTPTIDSPEIGKPLTKFGAVSDIVKNGRFDAAKMLGYSRSAEDLPIMDLEDQVLRRTLEDYNAYLKSGGKVPKFVEQTNEWYDKERNSHERQKDIPITVHPSYHDATFPDQSTIQLQDPEQSTDSETTVNLKGDLTCINGTFLPAPLSRHALIKYVK